MRKVLKLTRVLLKTAGASFNLVYGTKKGKGGKLTGAVLWLIVALSLSTLVFPLYLAFSNLFGLFSAGGNLSYATGLVINMGGLVVFMFSAFSTPALFYFSKDIESLLPMPLTATQIIGAKFLLSLIFELLTSAMVTVSMGIALWPFVPPADLIANMVIVLFTMPILPLVYATLLTMVLMRFSGFAKNRDVYNMVVGFIAIVFGLGVGLGSQRFTNITPEQMVGFIEGNRGALDALSSIFPNSIYAGMAAAGEGIWYQLVSLAIIAAALAVFFLLAKVLYFKGVIGISESSAPKKKMTRAQIAGAVSSRSLFASCLRKEINMLLRSPTAFMNCVLMVYLMPVLLIVSMMIGGNSAEIDIAAQFIPNYADPQTVSIIMVVASGLGFLLSAMDTITVTSITREGPNYFVMKYIPVSYRTQLIAKAASGLLVALPALVLILAGFAYLLKPPVLVFLSAAALTLPGFTLLNSLGLILDLMRPKLDWENETHAIKQNINVMIIMLGGMILIVPVVLLGIFVSFLGMPLLTFAVMFVLLAGLAVGAHVILLNTGAKRMAKLGE